MPAERYFIDESLAKHEKQILRGAEFHHLSRVMRTKVGEHVELVNGRGELASASVEAIAKDQATLSIQEYTTQKMEQQPIILAQGIPKPNRLDFILEKGTELGVSEFWLFPAQQSVKKEIYPSQMERMNSLMIAAMKQCGRLFLPKIVIKPKLDEWARWDGTAFFGDTDPQAELFWNVWRGMQVKDRVLFFIGPESGFSENETALLRNRGVKGVKLHSNILRTDTAAMMAAGLVSHWQLNS